MRLPEYRQTMREFERQIGEKDLVIWGKNKACQELCARYGARYILDRNDELCDTKIGGISISMPEKIYGLEPSKTVVLLCMAESSYREALRVLDEAGHFTVFFWNVLQDAFLSEFSAALYDHMERIRGIQKVLWGDEEKEWDRAYALFRDTTGTLNARAVLEGKPLRSYIRLTPKRRLSRHYIRLRGKYSIESCIAEYGGRESGKYVVYPHVTGRNPRDANSLPRIVNENSRSVFSGIWQDVKEEAFCGHKCYIVRESEGIISCFPAHMTEAVLNKEKSQLALRGNTYLWRIQQIQLELLVEFDRICRKHALRYNISFGTLLGAVRHKGFIPWDDDIDVTMPVEDFDRLDEIMREELDLQKYYFRCPANEENNHLIFKHLERRGTVYTKPGRQKLTQQIGVFIDIFPMYPSAHLRLADWVHAKICRHWRKALWATVGADSVQDEKRRKYYQRISAVGNKVCYERFVRAAKFFHNEKYLKFWIAQDRNPYKTPLVRRSNYVDTVELLFEGHSFTAPRDYESVLDYCFGHDWRKYPSTRGRRPAHNAITEIGDLYREESEGRQ